MAQQSKARKKEDFLIAFSPIIAEASAIAYKGTTNEVQSKLKRVIEVWKQRLIFEPTIQDAIEARIDGMYHDPLQKINVAIANGSSTPDLDKSRSTTKKSLLGNSLFSASGPSAPLEIQPLVPLQISISKAIASSSTAAATADIEYEKLTDPSKTVPTPPVHAARLSALLKSLASAEGAVVESIKARRALIDGLEKILETNKAALAGEQAQHMKFVGRKGIIEVKKRDVEDGIMRGLSADSSPTNTYAPVHLNGRAGTSHLQDSTPDCHLEEPTPPPIETLTPVGSPIHTFSPISPGNGSAASLSNPYLQHHSSTPSRLAETPPTHAQTQANLNNNNSATELLSTLTMPPARHYAGSPGAGGGLAKKRKLENDFEGFGGPGGDAMADLDEDVAELLRAEGGI